MKKLFIFVMVMLVATSCNSGLKKQLQNEIKNAKNQLENTQAEYANVCNQSSGYHETISQLTDSLETLNAVTLQLDSTILKLNKTLNPKNNGGSRVFNMGGARGANQSIVNDPRFKLK